MQNKETNLINIPMQNKETNFYDIIQKWCKSHILLWQELSRGHN